MMIALACARPKRCIRGLLLLFVAALALPAYAQQQTIILGQSAVLLAGPWKFSPGDSPWIPKEPTDHPGTPSNGRSLWAEPGFDDSHWASMDMTPSGNSVDPQFGTIGFLPGWTARGYPNLRGYAWYRLRIRVQDTGQPVWLSMPVDVDDAYQVFANGQYIGQFGTFGPRKVVLYYGHPNIFELPRPGPDGNIEIALRFYMSSVSPLRWPEAGGPHDTPMLGLKSTIDLQRSQNASAIFLNWIVGDFACVLFYVLALAPALWVFFHNRTERAWLWLVLALVCNACASAAQGLGQLNSHVSMWAGEFWADSIFMPAQQLFWTVFWWRWFDLANRRWIPRACVVLTVLNVVASFCFESPLLGFNFASQSLLRASSAAMLCIVSALGILIIVILVEGFRRDRTAALLATVPIILLEISSFYVAALVIFHIPQELYLGPVGIEYSDVAAIGLVLIASILSIRRFLANRDREVIEREAVSRDLEQARQLQQGVLVAEGIHSNFCSVLVEYHPAQTVGGDFFQTLTHADGSLTAIVGDVSGKGISAAMLVAVLVGAARVRARDTSDPTAILEELNRQIMGRAGGHFATCIAAALRADGTLRLANAGHLPPYRNGHEIKLEGSLPLGLADQLEPAVLELQLDPGDALTFLTDGVVEAQNAQGELFGFDRTAAIAAQPAGEIARTAQSSGQEDDITVLSLTFAPVAVEQA